jgi:hypothetical protein
MFVSMVGQASFHTTGRSGPSTIERSYRLAAGPADGKAAVSGAEVAGVDAVLKGPGRVVGGTRRGVLAEM